MDTERKMTSDLIFYTNPNSRGRIIRWMLEEVGTKYETIILDYATSMKSEEYKKINPMGKVPAIIHNGIIVTECAAICAYLADAFPDAGLAPLFDDPSRGKYLRALFFAAGPIEAAVIDKSRGIEISNDKKAIVGYGCFDDMISGAEALIGDGPFICGEKFSAADVYFGSQIAWGLQFNLLPKSKTFEKYVNSIISRSAYVRAREIDDALLKA